jgi:hypothetical protein
MPVTADQIDDGGTHHRLAAMTIRLIAAPITTHVPAEGAYQWQSCYTTLLKPPRTDPKKPEANDPSICGWRVAFNVWPQ